MPPPAEDAFASLAPDFALDPGVEHGTGFGRNPGLRVDGKIFVMVVRGELVMKLPADTCSALVAAGSGRPFDRGKGTPLKEWIVLDDLGALDVYALARQAHDFVSR